MSEEFEVKLVEACQKASETVTEWHDPFLCKLSNFPGDPECEICKPGKVFENCNDCKNIVTNWDKIPMVGGIKMYCGDCQDCLNSRLPNYDNVDLSDFVLED